LSELSEDRHLAGEWRDKADIDQSRFAWYRTDAFWSNLKSFLPGLRRIILAGGEPFLIRMQADFVKACCELGEACHISLQYHTNGTVFPDELVPYWEQFEHVHFMISIDGIGEVADYVRHPSDWEQILANIRRFDALGDNTLMQFHSTVHALNVYRLPDVLHWADSAGLRNRTRFSSIQDFVGTGLVLTPVHQDVRVLHPEFKRKVTLRLRDYIEKRPEGEPVDQLSSILAYMNSEDRSERMRLLVHQMAMFDRVRGSDVLRTFPELASCWPR
jgi:MoaA/NifB/PqqE/SkfB family radical SAM enzyme